MKNKNNYYMGYKESNNKIDYIKYELLNEFGYDLTNNVEVYNEDKIIKQKRLTKR